MRILDNAIEKFLVWSGRKILQMYKDEVPYCVEDIKKMNLEDLRSVFANMKKG